MFKNTCWINVEFINVIIINMNYRELLIVLIYRELLLSNIKASL